MQSDESDAELIERYARSREEAAFTELVQRHLRLVYAAACRETGGDAAAAEDITQLVFIELARKAGRLSASVPLAGWLYTSVRLVSANRRRAQQRRAIREQKAHIMNELQLGPCPAAEAGWESLRPVIDDALHALPDRDRDAVVLRFLEGQSLQAIGNALGLTENAARMRVDRALDKLRDVLEKRGIHSSASGLALSLGALASMFTPPAALAQDIVTGALTAASGASAMVSTVLSAVSVKVGLGLALAVVIGVGLWPGSVRRTGGSQAKMSSLDLPMSAAVLSGAMLFSVDSQGNPAGNFVWDTRGADSDFYKVWWSRGTPGGAPDGLVTAFVNGPSWAAATLHIPLREGTNQFTLFFQHNGRWPTMGLNLFFNTNRVPSISVKAPARDEGSIPRFSVNDARRSYSLTSYPRPNVRAAAADATTILDHPVEVVEFYHVDRTNFFQMDRVSSHTAIGDGQLDCVGALTLVVGPRRVTPPSPGDQ
jgi:RNA polymerase sigma factor (sigma-70 family)